MEDLLGNFSINRTSECKKWAFLLYFTYCFAFLEPVFKKTIDFSMSLTFKKNLKMLPPSGGQSRTSSKTLHQRPKKV